MQVARAPKIHQVALGGQFERPSGAQVAFGGQFEAPSEDQVALGVRLGAVVGPNLALKLHFTFFDFGRIRWSLSHKRMYGYYILIK